MKIGRRIKARRKELGMTQTEFAEKMGFKSRSSVNKLEGDFYALNSDKLSQLSEVLQMSVSELIGEDLDERMLQSQNEEELIGCCRKLNGEGQHELIKHAHLLVGSGIYEKKSDAASSATDVG